MSPPTVRPHQLSVLVYDGDQSSRDLLARHLVRDGHRVRTASTAADALYAAATDPPDVLVTEVGPTHEPAFGLATRIARTCPDPVFLIAFTSWPLSWCDSEEVRFDHRFVKTDDPVALLDSISTFDRRRFGASPARDTTPAPHPCF
jgi:DNA-binding response OmpR family regulator